MTFADIANLKVDQFDLVRLRIFLMSEETGKILKFRIEVEISVAVFHHLNDGGFDILERQNGCH